MNHRPFVRKLSLLAATLPLLLLLAAHAAAAQTSPPRKPNILVIVADDLGYADVACYGSKDIPTPHIDSLAKNGVRCTHGYVSGPYCSPTRAALMTGRYQQRYGHEFNPGPGRENSAHIGLSLNETTLADRLKAAGYATGMVGKWHLGYAEKLNPINRGFQEFFGFLGGSHSYLDAKADKANPILRGLQPVDEPEYLTEAFAREAVAYMDRHQKEPFFLYLTFNAVHMPLQATQKYLDRFPNITDEKRRTYAAMLSAMDDAIGAVLTRLRSSGIEDHTLIFFISDNGGPPVNGSSNGPLNGYKAQTLEGGIRVPFIVQWKRQLPTGKVYDRPVIQLDIHPTALAAADVKSPATAKLDGVNLLPYLAGKKDQPPHAALYWRFGTQRAIRQGDWKLVQTRNSPTYLFNLTTDMGETDDLSAKHPEKLRELEAAWKQWNSQLVEPAWGEEPRARQMNKAK